MLRIVNQDYIYLRLTPNHSIRNTNTHLIARAIASLHCSLWQSIRKEDGRYVIQRQAKVAFYVYIERGRVEFYFIVPKQAASVIQEKAGDAWSGLTVEEVAELPQINGAVRQLVYEKEDALSLRIDRRDNDLLNNSLNVVDVMEDGDKAGVLYNFMPTSQASYRHAVKATLTKLKAGQPVERNKTGAVYIVKLALSFIDRLIADVTEAIAGKRWAEQSNPLHGLLERLNGGHRIGETTERKAGATVLAAQIIVMAESPDALRQRNTAHSLVQSFDAVADDNRLIGKPFRGKINFRARSIAGAEVNRVSDMEAQHFITLPGRELLERFPQIQRVETQETEIPEDLRSGVMCIGDSTYRGNKTRAYLSNDREYKNLTLVLIGPTRAGKSTLIGNLGVDAIRAGECVIVFDYIKNCELSNEMTALFPADKSLIIDCGNIKRMPAMAYNEIGHSADPLEQYDNAKRSTAQLLTLVNAIVTNDSPLSPKMKRYLQSAAIIVFIAGGSIRDVFEVLQDHEVRRRYIARIPSTQKANLSKYAAGLAEIDETDKKGAVGGTKFSLIAGIVDRLNELEGNTYLERMLEADASRNVDLVKEIDRNQIICIRMPESAYSTDGERDVICTYWMTKLWLALQIRGHREPDRDKVRKVNLVIDELYQVRTTEKLLTEKLSRMAKFGCKPIISCHYLNQINGIREELRSANTSYMLIAGCDRKNHDELKQELYPYTSEDLQRLGRYHSLNYIKCRDGYARFITKLPAPT